MCGASTIEKIDLDGFGHTIMRNYLEKVRVVLEMNMEGNMDRERPEKR